MSPLKLSRTTAGAQEETVKLSPQLEKQVEAVLATGVTLETVFKEGMEEVVKKHGNP